MTTVSITEDQERRFHAVSGHYQSVGKTIGEALDAVTEQMDEGETPALVLIQKRVPDRFFTAAQHHRMEDLRSRRSLLTDAERAELQALVEAELDATVDRTDAMIQQIGA